MRATAAAGLTLALVVVALVVVALVLVAPGMAQAQQRPLRVVHMDNTRLPAATKALAWQPLALSKHLLANVTTRRIGELSIGGPSCSGDPPSFLALQSTALDPITKVPATSIHCLAGAVGPKQFVTAAHCVIDTPNQALEVACKEPGKGPAEARCETRNCKDRQCLNDVALCTVTTLPAGCTPDLAPAHVPLWWLDLDRIASLAVLTQYGSALCVREVRSTPASKDKSEVLDWNCARDPQAKAVFSELQFWPADSGDPIYAIDAQGVSLGLLGINTRDDKGVAWIATLARSGLAPKGTPTGPKPPVACPS